ncbi:MAG: hypothetical protein NTV34_07825 [Proteobacteria bacterium]|nr:hypothetical protein [Pseudomonadota bacterium]
MTLNFPKILNAMTYATVFYASLNIASCRDRISQPSAESKSVTSKGFTYKSIKIKITDKNDQPLVGIPVSIRSWRWSFEFISHDPLLGLPGIGDGWKWNSDGGEILGLGTTSKSGQIELKNVSIKARGKFPGESPAGVQFSAVQELAPLCPDGRNARGNYVKLNLKTIQTEPEKTNPDTRFPPNTTFEVDRCIFTIGANEDKYDRVVLDCKSDRSAAEIQADLKAYMLTCPT